MESFNLNLSTAEDLFHKIKMDIDKFRKKGIYERQLGISIPNHLQQLLIYYKKRDIYFDGNSSLGREFYNIEIVPGYNNQICVFDKMSTPTGFTVQPIIINYD